MEVDLTPIDPRTALETYLEHRANEDLAKQTIRSHRYRLNHFVRWCEENDIDNLNPLGPRELQDYRNWRKRDGDLNNVSWHTQMSTFRVFIKWAENYEAVRPGLHKRLDVPDLDPDEDARDYTFSKERADRILEYLNKFEYASKKHALFALMWHTGIRIGAVNSLDLQDFHPDERYIEIRNRPEQGTRLKNREKGERPISIADQEVQILKDYIEKVREEVTDDYGRKPLFTTRQGRAHITTLRSWIYRIARPCLYRDCPHDRDPEKCEAKQQVKHASDCPSSFSPHTIRRSSITMWLDQDVPMQAVSDRMNAEENALEKHYDKRTEKGKMEQRKNHFI
jgi:site-specific recombinase XerD